MEIRRSGWVYRMAYPKWWSNYQPDRPSLCSLFWRVLAMTLIVRLVMLSLLQMAGFLFANKVDLAGMGRDLYVPYESWPTIRGHRVWPIAILALIGAVALAVDNPEVLKVGGLVVAVIVSVVSVAFGIAVFIVGGIPAIRKNEAVKLTVEYIKAKKQKVCPLVKVVD
ncbi:MAG: hypothetical protein Q8P76_00860 [bacterium]|nr:hypothetical protein [bacterium]